MSSRVNKLEAVVRRCSVKKFFLKISQNLQENICARVSFLIKLQVLGLVQVFSCEFYEIFKKAMFYRTSLVAAPDKQCLRHYVYIISHMIHQNLIHIYRYNKITIPKQIGISINVLLNDGKLNRSIELLAQAIRLK